MNDSPAQPARRPGFTLVELLVVIGIIALLVSILISVVGRVRLAAQGADTQATIRAIDSAVTSYYGDHQAYPGPLGDAQLGAMGTGLPPVKTGTDGFFRGGLTNVTASENLVLGLIGGLVPVTTGTTTAIQYDPAAVGRGPTKLGGRSPGGYSAYFDANDATLSMHEIGDSDVSQAGATANAGKWGRFVDDVAAAQDSIIPEFVDRFTNPLPILYLRANAVGRITEGTITSSEGKIIATDDPVGNASSVAGVYNELQIAAYVAPTSNNGPSIGVGKSPAQPYTAGGMPVTTVPGSKPYYHGLQLPLTANIGTTAALRDTMAKGGAGATYPYDIRAYLTSPTTVGARQGDRYVLISAGRDRIYGTEDDLTNFGSVLP